MHMACKWVRTFNHALSEAVRWARISAETYSVFPVAQLDVQYAESSKVVPSVLVGEGKQASVAELSRAMLAVRCNTVCGFPNRRMVR